MAEDGDCTDERLHGRTDHPTDGGVDDGHTGRTPGAHGPMERADARTVGQRDGQSDHGCTDLWADGWSAAAGADHEVLCARLAPSRKDLLFYRLISP